MPSTLDISRTVASVASLGAPPGVIGTNGGALAVTTLAIPGRREIVDFKDGPGPPSEVDAYTAIVNADGFVLARRVGYDDWVLRPAAADAIATPPIKPMIKAMLRYSVPRRLNVAVNRYHATRNA
jgi:hypothetical protein